jgi:hypothetical protein
LRELQANRRRSEREEGPSRKRRMPDELEGALPISDDDEEEIRGAGARIFMMRMEVHLDQAQSEEEREERSDEEEEDDGEVKVIWKGKKKSRSMERIEEQRARRGRMPQWLQVEVNGKKFWGLDRWMGQQYRRTIWPKWMMDPEWIIEERETPIEENGQKLDEYVAMKRRGNKWIRIYVKDDFVMPIIGKKLREYCLREASEDMKEEVLRLRYEERGKLRLFLSALNAAGIKKEEVREKSRRNEGKREKVQRMRGKKHEETASEKAYWMKKKQMKGKRRGRKSEGMTRRVNEQLKEAKRSRAGDTRNIPTWMHAWKNGEPKKSEKIAREIQKWKKEYRKKEEDEVKRGEKMGEIAKWKKRSMELEEINRKNRRRFKELTEGWKKEMKKEAEENELCRAFGDVEISNQPKNSRRSGWAKGSQTNTRAKGQRAKGQQGKQPMIC